MSAAPDPDRPIHPDFDGHLERPVETMTPEERVRWAMEAMELMEWARRLREMSAPETPSKE